MILASVFFIYKSCLHISLLFVFCKYAASACVPVAVLVPVLCLISYILYSHLHCHILLLHLKLLIVVKGRGDQDDHWKELSL